jgi:hypothetical protein
MFNASGSPGWAELPGGDAGHVDIVPRLARVFLSDRSISKFPEWFNSARKPAGAARWRC